MTVHSDKSSLLDSLKIEREPVRRKGPSPVLYGTLALGLLAAGAAGWYFWPDSRIPVHVITAAQEGAGGGGGASLDASGYVVARRKATLSAKIQYADGTTGLSQASSDFRLALNAKSSSAKRDGPKWPLT